MATQGESRAILGHLVNISMPFSRTDRVWAKICNTTDLTEEFNPDTDDIQYICDTTKTTLLKSYRPTMEINMIYQKDNKLQNYFNTKVRRLPIGSETETEYIRFNENETKFNSSNQFVGVRRDASVYFDSVGGAAEDPLSSTMILNGSGDGEVGYVQVTKTDDRIEYTWVPANTEVPYLSKIGGVKIGSYYSGVTVTLTADSKLTVEGEGGVNGGTITAQFPPPPTPTSPANEITGTTATVGPDGKWTMNITGLTAGDTYKIAFKQTVASVDSVDTMLFVFKIASPT